MVSDTVLASRMPIKTSLHFRVTLAFALLGATVSTLLGATIYVAMHDLEQRLIDQALVAEMEDYISRRARNPHSPPPNTSVVRGFVEPSERFSHNIPDVLKASPPGAYELMLDGRPYRATIAAEGGTRFYLLHDVGQAVERNQAVIMLIISGVLLATLASVLAGYLLARQVIRPVRLLVERVAQANADSAAPDLSSGFPADEVGRLARTFEGYLQRIHGFIERERSFTANLSHELRTPLTVIRGAADLLLADPQVTPQQHSRIERIHRAAEEMSEVTPALLSLAREAPSPDAITNVAQEVRRLMDNHAYLLASKPVQLEVTLPDEFLVQADPALLRVVIGNLIRNAYSYTDEGHIDISLAGNDFIISDTGEGIDPELFRNLFEPHLRGARGSGIGLSLVKRICEHYQWQLAVESDGHNGTVIRLRFTASPSLHTSFTSP